MRGRERLRRIAVWGGLLALTALAPGCATSQARLLHPGCHRVERGNRLDALAFTVTVQTQGLLGEQLVYEVSLQDAAARPIRSTDGRYQNKAGAVAASKTLVVLRSPSTFEDLRLSIPASELPARKGDWPVAAVFRLYNVAGECLAQASCAVPPEPEQRVAATRPAGAAPPRATTAPQTTTPPARADKPAATRPVSRPAASAPASARAARPATTRPTSPPTPPAPPKDQPPPTQPTTRPTPPRPVRPLLPPAPPARRGGGADWGRGATPDPAACLREIPSRSVSGAMSSSRPSARSQ